jgi:hypothetical protein
MNLNTHFMNTVNKFLSIGMVLGCSVMGSAQAYLSSIVSVSQGPKVDLISPVDANRSDSGKMLGAPEDTDVFGPINFFTLGMGGEVVVELSAAVCNRVGADLTIVETTWNLNCTQYPEKARVWASQDLCNWIELTSETEPVCHNGDLELGCFPWVKYLKIKDVSPDNYASDGDGYDIDGIIGYQTCSLPAETGLSRYAATGFLGDPQATQGLTEIGTPVPSSRDIPSRMLGLPANLSNIYANDVATTPANNNFFSLGNGGSAVLAFSYALFNGPGSDIQIFETSFFDNSTRTCSNYPEKVKVQGSCDGENFYDLVLLPEDAGNGESAGSNVLCRDGKLDLGSLPFITYLKLTDVTFQGICNFPGIGDGYDVNAVFGLQNCTPLARTDESFISDNAVMEDELLVEIWPNPAKERLNINLLSSLAGDVNLELTDLSGRRVHFENLAQGDVNMIRELSLEQYQPGIYFLTISSNDQKVVHKVVKE